MPRKTDAGFDGTEAGSINVYLSSRVRHHTLDKNKAIGELLKRNGDIDIFGSVAIL